MRASPQGIAALSEATALANDATSDDSRARYGQFKGIAAATAVMNESDP
jgi:hypothetical protein